MAIATALRAAVACALAAPLLAASAGHPVEKVVSLLQGLGEKVEEERKTEEVTYTKFEYWCRNSKKTLETAIAEGKAKIDQLSSEIESHEKNIEVLSAGIEEHETELQDLDKGDSKANKEREAGANLYKKESSALTDTIKAIGDAVKLLVEAKGKTDALLLAQQSVRVAAALAGSKATAQQRELLWNFGAEEPEETPKERPDLKAKGDNDGHVKKYSFKSDSVVELLKELKLKFEDELTGTNTAETNALNAHTLATKAREDLRNAAKDSKKAKESDKGEAESALGTAEQDLSDTKGDFEADSGTHEETEKACDVKASEWAERTETREKEKEAIAAAIKILAKVTGVRTEAPSNPVPPPSPVELLQKIVPGGNPQVQKALTLLRSEAKTEHSKALQHLADALATRGDKGPFDDIVNMIQKMVFRLMHEQKEEDDHKNWCDLETNKTNASIADKEDKMDELSTKITEHKAKAIKLAGDIKESNDMVSNIDTHMGEATEIRKIGKQENKMAMKDAEDAQLAIANAVAVLKDFYKSSGQMPKESWEFLQGRIQARAHLPVELPEEPSTWDASYTGVADPANQPDGIVTLLETVSADFSKMASQTEAQESSDQEAYDEDTKRCKIEKARRTKESEMKAQERKRVMEKQASMEATHKSVKGEKEATEQYLKDLQPACVEGDSTYEDRKAARAGEIEALKSAQDTLQTAFDNSTNTTADENPPVKSFLQLRGARRA